MNKLLIILFLIGSFEVTCQTYKLLPDSCTFCLFLSSTGGNSWVSSNFGLDPNNDTIVAGNSYMMLNDIGNQSDRPFAFRQLGNRVYGVVQDSVNEFLILDFDAVVGDTIYNLYSEGFYYDAVVDEKDSILVNNSVFHHFVQLEGIRVNLQGTWFNYSWSITWNERALCGYNYTGGWADENLGGLLHNIPSTLYSISIPYAAPAYCTTDPLYNIPSNVNCTNCLPQTNSITEITNREVTFSPNPVQANIHLELGVNDFYSVEIFDSKGILVHSNSECSGMSTIDVSNLFKGVYYISIKSDEIRRVNSFIKL